MAHLALALLGPFQAALDGQPLATLTAGRLQALLTYLAVESGREHSRAALAGFFWPERPDREALSALRYALSNLRQAIGDPTSPSPFLLITRHTIQFNWASDHWLDVDDFASPGYDMAAQSASVESLTSAIALYRGEFLAGLALADSLAFEEWLLLKREQFHRQALTLLRHLAILHEGYGRYGPAADYTRSYLALEPWNEAAHRRLMRLLALGGQRHAALVQYETCRQVLANELGITPEDDTTRLYESIRDRTLTPPRQVETPPAAMLTDHRAPAAGLFVGRESELARLDRFLDLALAGQGQVVFVCGEAGSGKTTLLTEFVRRALTARANLLHAVGRGAAQAGRGDPYLPFREILSWLCDNVGTAQWQRLESALPAVVGALIEAGPGLLDTLVPGESLLRRAKLLAPSEADWPQRLAAVLTWRRGLSPAPGQPADLMNQVSQVLHSIARQQPLLLVLDDMQWADPDSISLLFHLGRQLGDSRILIACAYRPADLRLGGAERHPLLSVIHEFQREWGETVIDLDQAEGQSFVDAYLDSAPNRLDGEFRARLCRTAGGNPLFTDELVHSLQERGQLIRDMAGRWVAGSTLDWRRMPLRVEAVIAERVDRLPAEWRAILDAASVAGEEFDAELVARVLNADERAVLHALSGSLSKQQRLVQFSGLNQTARGQRLSRYRFRHGLFQQYLYHQLDEAERASLHEAVGSQLEALLPEQAADLAPLLAWHFEVAGVLDRAADYYLAAGHRAYRLSSHEEAIAHYRAGLTLLSRLPSPADPGQRQATMRRELALYLGLGRPLVATRGWADQESADVNQRAYDLAAELAGQGELSPEFLLAFHVQVGTAAAKGEFGQALAFSRHLFTLAQQNGGRLALGLAHGAMGTSHLFRGECALGREHLEAVAALYHIQPLRSPDSLTADIGVNCMSWLSFVLGLLGYPEEAMGRGRAAITLARGADIPLSHGLALTVAGCSLHIIYRQRRAVQAYAAELLALAQAKELLLFREWVEIALGWGQVEAGEFEPGIARMVRGTRAWQQMSAVVGSFLHLGLLAEAYGKAGRVDQGLACVDEGLTLLRRVGSSLYEPEFYRIRGELLRLKADANAEHEAEQCFWQAIEAARRQETRWWELRAAVSLARLWQARGATYRRRARQMLTGLYNWFSEGFDLPDLREARAMLQELTHETEWTA